MAVTITAFAQVFKDVGLSSATIQKRDLTHAQTSIMFWLNGAVGLLLTLCIAAIAPLLVWFYHKPELLWITMVLGTSFFFSGLGVQHSALLNREMRFRALAVTQVGGMAAGVAAAVISALAGWGYWALVVKVVATSATSVILLWCCSDWRPGRPARAAGSRALFKFGANVTGFNVLNYFSRNLDNVLIGRVWGADALGLYSRAYALLMLPISNLRNPLNAVAFPALSHLAADPTRFRRYMRKYLSVLGFVSMPVVAFLFVCSDSAMDLLLGPKWVGASTIFRVLALTAFFQPVKSLTGVLLLSMGQSKRYFHLGIITSAFTVLGFGIGVFWGPVGVAAAYGIVVYASTYPVLAFACKATPVKALDFITATGRPAVVSIAAGALAFLLKNHLPWKGDFTVLVACGVTFALSYLALYASSPAGRQELRDYASYAFLVVSSRLGKRKPAPALEFQTGN